MHAFQKKMIDECTREKANSLFEKCQAQQERVTFICISLTSNLHHIQARLIRLTYAYLVKVKKLREGLSRCREKLQETLRPYYDTLRKCSTANQPDDPEIMLKLNNWRIEVCSNIYPLTVNCFDDHLTLE